METLVAPSSLRVLCWGTYDVGKPRTRILHDGLRRRGVQLSECRARLWDAFEDKSQVKNPLTRLRLLARWLLAYPVLIARFLFAPRPDFVLVGYPGFLDVLVLMPFARLRHTPIVWDMFMSVYDTAVLDRRLSSPAALSSRCLYQLERLALRCSRCVFLDTQAHARRVEELFRLPAKTCGSVWVGVETAHFASTQVAISQRAANAPLKVLFYGQFIPLHGIETIVEAARKMKEQNVEWTLIGKGQVAPTIERMLTDEPLAKLRWIDWVDYANLRHWIERSDVCLGIFGSSIKSASVIPNKVFQILAARRPLITRDSPAIRELLTPSPPCIYLVPPSDADGLVEALRDHQRSLDRPAPSPCHEGLLDRIDSAAVAGQFLTVVEQLAPR